MKSFVHWLATRRYGSLEHIDDGVDKHDKGMIYADSLYIEEVPEGDHDMGKNQVWRLTLDRSEYTSDNLRRLEELLYQFYIEEEIDDKDCQFHYRFTFESDDDVHRYLRWLKENDLLFHFDDDPSDCLRHAGIDDATMQVIDAAHASLWEYTNPWDDKWYYIWEDTLNELRD